MKKTTKKLLIAGSLDFAIVSVGVAIALYCNFIVAFVVILPIYIVIAAIMMKLKDRSC